MTDLLDYKASINAYMADLLLQCLHVIMMKGMIEEQYVYEET